ncbi:interferon-induced very large GTPase 1-like [Ostrea edulis]|uniref:interferon-induced very large GTPase 1-like n=1 Tax=Ostrea edulis TaxID=37623 RepID=UPI0024AEBC03|nr:interferon-induced very large GTPase 1-like [Ostrea edulis]
MIEIFWYKVDPQKDSPLKLPCTLLNWRGGIQEETEKSKLDLLQKMSDVLVVFVSKDFSEKPETRDFLKVKGMKPIVVISDPDDKTYVQLKSPKKCTYSTIPISNLEKKLSESIEKHLSGRKLHSLDKYFAKYPSPHVDEQCEECKTGKKIAMMIIDRIPKHENGMICKANIIPLQGEKLWMTWSKIEKKNRKKGQDDFNAAEPLMHSMQTVRMEQIKACNEASEVVAMFVKALLMLSDSDDTLLYFVFWFKQELEEASRHIVQKCQKKGMKVRSDLRANKSHERNLDGLLSIEHFLREIGQIYEAFLSKKAEVELKYETETILLKLPGVVAKLSYLGQPLEIMDGDAGNVPLLWLKEVFAEMSNITNNEKIASISVIGVQSSGKSTLLNTMFGIQYPVSAGRCTRGIFAQFIPVCRKTSKFGYVMVLDTEGLRASEKIDESINSDNEIAAFTVGLSDVSIINIKGESEADMRDILQIVVHALMRLKKTESGPEYTQSGIFVHQNVSGINIHDKTAAGNAAFMRHLDKMAEIAAQEEQIPNVNTFTSVVDLNPEIDRIYVPNLLKNDASVTASVSKGYCRSIEDTKARIFAKLKENRDVFCNAKEKYLNIRTLWKGIQAETFIFSFRNCQEAIASRILEREFKKIAWHFEEKKMGWWNKNDKKLLEAELDNVENCAEKLKEDFWEMLRMENENAKSEMDQFITNHQYVKFMEHRRQRTLENFMSLCNGLKCIIDRKINVEKAQRLEFLKQYHRMITEQSKIKEEATELADNMKNTEINEETLKEEFDKWWNKYVDERCSQYESLDIKSTNLKKEMENILRHVYGINMTIEREEASHKFPKMKNSISRCDIAEDYLRVVCESDEKSDSKQLAVNVLNLSFEKIDRYLEALVDKDSRFDDFHFNILLKYVIDDVEKHNKMHYTTFAITESFTNKVICHVTQYVFPIFLSLNIEHEEMYGMRSQLSKCKLNALRIFKSQFHQIVEKRNEEKRLEKSVEELKLQLEKAIDEQTRQKQEEEMKRRKKEDEDKRKREKEDRAYLNIESSTDCIISQLKEYANYRFTEHLRYKIKEEVIEQFKGQKHLLMKSVLIDLANENSGNKYPSYISSPETFVLEWITNYSKRMFFEDNEDDKSKYELCRGNVVIPIASSALGCLSQLRRDQNVKNMKDWLAGFRELLSGQDIIISSESLEGAEYEIEDFNLLCNVLTTKMKDLQTEMTNNQDRSIKWKGKTPYEEIMEHLWGCKENCPWCNEPCKSSIPNHADKQNCHECIQHRPCLSDITVFFGLVFFSFCSATLSSDTNHTTSPLYSASARETEESAQRSEGTDPVTSDNVTRGEGSSTEQTSALNTFIVGSDTGQSIEGNHTVVATARGVFDHQGGVLQSPETGVSIVIPKGAIPDGVKQEIYFKVCKDNNILPPLDKDKFLFLEFSVL